MKSHAGSQAASSARSLIAILGSYWTFTVTDGALRMLVVLYFTQLGYDPFTVALLFLGYEIAGVFTNLFGGWLAARLGLRASLLSGLALQLFGLAMLTSPEAWLTPLWVLLAQSLSGIAKDLNKTAAKSAIKVLTQSQGDTLLRWTSLVTGSKNALKGVGFFVGGALLTWLGFQTALVVLATLTLVLLVTAFWFIEAGLGRASYKAKIRDLFSSSAAINQLSAARFFLFASRDIWFVVALPVCLQNEFGWSSVAVGTFLACWVMGYGATQSATPLFGAAVRANRAIVQWSGLLIALLVVLTLALTLNYSVWILICGLLAFGALFAVISALHSFLILAYADDDGVSLDVGFYYMANAGGRLVGTLISGALYQLFGLLPCLLCTLVFLVLATIPALSLPTPSTNAWRRAAQREVSD